MPRGGEGAETYGERPRRKPRCRVGRGESWCVRGWEVGTCVDVVACRTDHSNFMLLRPCALPTIGGSPRLACRRSGEPAPPDSRVQHCRGSSGEPVHEEKRLRAIQTALLMVCRLRCCTDPGSAARVAVSLAKCRAARFHKTIVFNRVISMFLCVGGLDPRRIARASSSACRTEAAQIQPRCIDENRPTVASMEPARSITTSHQEGRGMSSLPRPVIPTPPRSRP